VPGWTAERTLAALAVRSIDAEVAPDGVRLTAPKRTLAIARAVLEDRARFAGDWLEVFGLVQTLPVDALPRLAAWPAAPGLVAVIVSLDDWSAFRDEWLENFVSRRWHGRHQTVQDDAPARLRWQMSYTDDELRVRVTRAGDGEVAIVDVERRRLDATLDPEPVVWLPDDDEPTYDLSRTTLTEARVTRRVGRDEVLVLVQRVSAEHASMTAIGWDAARER
jgi:hypothetical protein